ncbi:F0F1 ATP synthase subunit gamma [Algoriphagus sp. SE2]|uniref:F0F1 ATP synthase subunit gamma n=1 Tax=Algoriphagus sp. SE2 TaxID=3141536 RepID=UPI0031CCDEE5
METLADIRRKLTGAEDLKSVVRTMKAMAASNIGQYEQAVNSLGDYNRTINLGIIAYFKERQEEKKITEKERRSTCAIVFGSDQGLVGQFNNSLSDFVSEHLDKIKGTKIIWAVGDRIKAVLEDRGFDIKALFSVPGSVKAITPLVSQILLKSEGSIEVNDVDHVYIFHNQPNLKGTGYSQKIQQLFPIVENWKSNLSETEWPSKLIPQVAGSEKATLLALIREYLFISLFRASAESLASENASRLAAMQRAEKNIDELLDTLNHKFHSIRQSMIDEELFDVVSGFEALKDELNK